MSDGYTSSALLLNYLHCIVPGYVENYITYYTHEGKEHGVALDEIPPWIEFLVVPDAGTNDTESCAVLAERNIPVLLIDHHLRDKDNPYACIINN